VITEPAPAPIVPQRKEVPKQDPAKSGTSAAKASTDKPKTAATPASQPQDKPKAKKVIN